MAIGTPTYGAAATGSDVASLSVEYPATIGPGNLLFLWCYMRENVSGGWSQPAGWSTYAATNTANGTYGLYYKYATGSESGNLTVTASTGGGNFNATIARMFCVTGAGLITSGATESEASSPYANAGVTPPRNGAMVFQFDGVMDITSASETDTFQTWANGTNLGSWTGVSAAAGSATSGRGAAIGVGWATQTTAAATGSIQVALKSGVSPSTGISISLSVDPGLEKSISDTITVSDAIACAAYAPPVTSDSLTQSDAISFGSGPILDTGFPVYSTTTYGLKTATSVTISTTKANQLLVAVIPSYTFSLTALPLTSVIASGGTGTVGTFTRQKLLTGASTQQTWTAEIWAAWASTALTNKIITFNKAGTSQSIEIPSVYAFSNVPDGSSDITVCFGANGGKAVNEGGAAQTIDATLTGTINGSYIVGAFANGFDSTALTPRSTTPATAWDASSNTTDSFAVGHLVSRPGGDVTIGATDSKSWIATAAIEILEATAAGATEGAISESLTESDGLAGNKAASEDISDSITASDNIDVREGIPVSTSDSVSITDGVAVNRAAGWLVSDQLTQSDAAAANQTVARLIADSLVQSDAILSIAAASASASDQASFTDQLVASLSAALGIFESTTFSDAAAGVTEGAHTGDIADSITSSDFISSSLGVTQAISDALAASDATARSIAAAFSISDQITQSDAVAHSAAASQATADQITQSDAAARSIAVGLSISDSVTESDQAAFTAGITTGVSDSISLADNLEVNKAVPAAISDSLTESDNVNSTGAGEAALNFSDQTTLSDALGYNRTASRSVSDSITASDNAASAAATTKSISDSLTESDSQVARNVAASHFISDSSTTSDSAVAFKGTTASVSDSLSVTDSIAPLKNAAAVLSDAITESESSAIQKWTGPTVKVSSSFGNKTIADGAGTTITATVNAAAGDLLVAVLSSNEANLALPSTIGDSQSLTWTSRRSEIIASGTYQNKIGVEIWTAPVTGSITSTVTCTYGGTTTRTQNLTVFVITGSGLLVGNTTGTTDINSGVAIQGTISPTNTMGLILGGGVVRPISQTPTAVQSSVTYSYTGVDAGTQSCPASFYGYAPSGPTLVGWTDSAGAMAFAAVEIYGGGIYGTFSETLTQSDSMSASISVGKSISDAITQSDSALALSAQGNTLSDALAVTDAVAASVVGGKSLSDTLTITDAIAVGRNIGLSLSDALTMSDRTYGNATKVRISDVLTVSEACAAAVGTTTGGQNFYVWSGTNWV